MAYKIISQTGHSKTISKPLATQELLGLRGARVLGVNPPVRDFAFMDLWSKPLGLLYLLQSLRTRNDVQLLDCIAQAADGEKSFGRVKIRKEEVGKPEVYRMIPRKYSHFGLTKSEIISLLERQERPDYILLTSAMTYWYPGVSWAIGVLQGDISTEPRGTRRHICKPLPGACGGTRGRLYHWRPLRAGGALSRDGPLWQTGLRRSHDLLRLSLFLPLLRLKRPVAAIPPAKPRRGPARDRLPGRPGRERLRLLRRRAAAG